MDPGDRGHISDRTGSRSEILISADNTYDPIDIQPEIHSSRAVSDDHVSVLGRLLPGLECDQFRSTCFQHTFKRGPPVGNSDVE